MSASGDDVHQENLQHLIRHNIAQFRPIMHIWSNWAQLGIIGKLVQFTANKMMARQLDTIMYIIHNLTTIFREFSVNIALIFCIYSLGCSKVKSWEKFYLFKAKIFTMLTTTKTTTENLCRCIAHHHAPSMLSTSCLHVVSLPPPSSAHSEGHHDSPPAGPRASLVAATRTLQN